MEIRTPTLDELVSAPNWGELLAGYADECSIDGIGKADMQIGSYRTLMDSGLLKVLAAYEDGQLVGFMSMISTVLPHYGKHIAVGESFYVDRKKRHTGAGTALIRAAEDMAAAGGALALMLSAPAGGKLERLMQASRGYEKTNSVWLKRVGALAGKKSALPAMTEDEIWVASEVESYMLQQPQVEIPVRHALHGGMYHRTITIPNGVAITGALIRVATLLIIDGDCEVYTGDDVAVLSGRNVLQCKPNRKQLFLAQSDVHMTMVFPTDATTVEEAEDEMTIESENLQSRQKEI